MAVIPLLAMVRKDLQLFFSDRRSVIVSFVVPIAIASFFGSIFAGGAGSDNRQRARIAVVMVDQDGSTISRGVLADAQADPNLNVSTADEAAARDAVRRGATSVGVIIPRGFGDEAGAAFFGDAAKPSLDLVYDPSRNFELSMVRGVLTEHVMQAVSR